MAWLKCNGCLLQKLSFKISIFLIWNVNYSPKAIFRINKFFPWNCSSHNTCWDTKMKSKWKTPNYELVKMFHQWKCNKDTSMAHFGLKNITLRLLFSTWFSEALSKYVLHWPNSHLFITNRCHSSFWTHS